MKDANFPIDAQWTDIDIMASFLDFTYDSNRFHNLPELIQSLHDTSIHYVNIIDPGISSIQPPGSYIPFDEGIRRKIFITKYNSSDPIIGKV